MWSEALQLSDTLDLKSDEFLLAVWANISESESETSAEVRNQLLNVMKRRNGVSCESLERLAAVAMCATALDGYNVLLSSLEEENIPSFDLLRRVLEAPTTNQSTHRRVAVCAQRLITLLPDEAICKAYPSAIAYGRVGVVQVIESQTNSRH